MEQSWRHSGFHRKMLREWQRSFFLHGNAGTIHQRPQIVAALFSISKVNVLALSYRGYGRSSGAPSEKGLGEDAACALEHLRQRTDIDSSRIYVYGQSLGGACALSLLPKHGAVIKGIVLENTFLSVKEVVKASFPYLSGAINYFLGSPWNSEQLVRELSSEQAASLPQFLFLSAENDEIIPSSHMKQLFQLLGEKVPAQKREKHFFVSFGNSGHNDTWIEQNYFNYIFVFLYLLSK